MTSLLQYIRLLIQTLSEEEVAGFSRMRRVVGSSRARITLDQESVDVYFADDVFHVEVADTMIAVDGSGATDSATVLALLDGVLEVGDAILDARLRVEGPLQGISRMFIAIEILLDASSRSPRLQALANLFRSERKAALESRSSGTGRIPWYPFACSAVEYELLKELDLLPDEH